jgi:hypothetical protein
MVRAASAPCPKNGPAITVIFEGLSRQQEFLRCRLIGPQTMPIPGNTSPESLIRPSSKRHRTVIEGSTKDARSMKTRFGDSRKEVRAVSHVCEVERSSIDALAWHYVQWTVVPWHRFFRRCLGGLPTMPRRVAANKAASGRCSPYFRYATGLRRNGTWEVPLPFDQRARSARSTSANSMY